MGIYDRHFEMKVMIIILKGIQIYFWFITDLSVHFQMIGVTVFLIWWGGSSFRNDWVSFQDDYPCSLISEAGGFTSYHNEKDTHFFYHIQGSKKGYKENGKSSQNHSEILSSRKIKSFFKTLDRKCRKIE